MYRYEPAPLPYAHNALEPRIDLETMRVHHGKHLQTYTDNPDGALADLPQLHSWPLEKLLQHPEKVPESSRNAVRNNAGGVYNHNFYFKSLSATPRTEPAGKPAKAIDEAFENFKGFKTKFKSAALEVFGSGWTWLVRHAKYGLKILTTSSQDTVLHPDVSPLLLVDVREHAYYLKYRNKRADYLGHWFKVVDWKTVETRYYKVKSES